MACANCEGLKAFYCPVCQPTGIDTRDIHARAPIDRIEALEDEIARLRAELDTAKGKLARIRAALSPECKCGCTDAFCRLETRIYGILNGKEA